MHFYCHHCGIETEVLPEAYLFPPIQVCSQCNGMEREKWLPKVFPWQDELDEFKKDVPTQQYRPI